MALEAEAGGGMCRRQRVMADTVKVGTVMEGLGTQVEEGNNCRCWIRMILAHLRIQLDKKHMNCLKSRFLQGI